MQSPVKFFSVEEYLQLEETSEIRHEYLSGQVFAMTGGSKEHNIITLNIASRVRSPLGRSASLSHVRGSSCSVFMADMKVMIQLADQNESIFYYPDVIVTCNPQDQDTFLLDYPCLIIEVLSPSTETTDRREKLVNYRTLETLEEYVLISPDEIKVEVYRKDSRGNWLLETLGKDDKLQLTSVGLNLTMSDIYEDVFTI